MQPLVFEPYLRPQIWGQRRLGERLGKALPSHGTFGESWEISGYPRHVSRVAEGELRGRLLSELWETHGEALTGSRVPTLPCFPLLIKFLDCHELLSVQVHPNDEAAQGLLKEDSGKTEAWVVLDVEKTARIYAGLKPGMTQADLEGHLDAGSVAECLHSFVPRSGDCIYLPAGTVHAAGGGVLIAEVQQTSDATFRLFDWNRVGPDGKPRALHRTQALAAIDWTTGPVQVKTPTPLAGVATKTHGERLVECEYFCMERYLLGGSFAVPYAGRMSIWMVLEGAADLRTEDGYQRRFRKGETLLLPASAGEAFWTAEASRSVSLLAVTTS